MRSVVSIAGVALALELPDASFSEKVLEVWTPFLTRTTPDWTLRSTLSPRFRTELRAEEQVLPPTARSGNEVHIEGANFRLVLHPARRHAELVQAEGRFAVETAVKMVLAEALDAGGGFLVHGVGLASGGMGALFTGASGAGKSTLGEWALQGGMCRLADELVGVLPEGGGYRLHGTPWNVGVPETCSLSFVGRLRHAPGPALSPAPAAELLRLLMPNTLLTDGTAGGRARRFRDVSALLRQVPSRELAFAPRTDVAGCVMSALQNPAR